MKHLNITLLLFATAIFTAVMQSCGSSDEPSVEKPTRSVLVYMAANNNLSINAYYDLKEIIEGAKDISGGHLLIYYHRPNQEPRLIEITPDGEEKTLKTYDTSESSVSIARMRQVVADARSVDTNGKLGLVFWSHGTGWLNDGGVIDEDVSQSPAASPLSFGVDEENGVKRKMKITSLRRALEGNTYDFIYFDCCHMATVEVAYELRRLTPQIAACPTELGLEGMPYDKNLKHLFSATPELPAAIKNTYNYYATQGTVGCCISIINTSGLDRLAELSRQILQIGQLPKNEKGEIDYKAVRYFNTRVMTSGIYDMKHYFNALLSGSNNQTLLNNWNKTFSDVITTTYTTPRVYGLDASEFSGLGCNILDQLNTPEKYGYDETSWYRDVVAR